MKKILLSVAFLASSMVFGQNLIQNGSCDEYQEETGDNADAFDMTPNSTVKVDGGGGATSPSPYRFDATTNPNGWRNDDLETYLETTYQAGGAVDEQPGSSSNGTYDGATKTRSVKLYDDGGQGVAVTESTRRIYQKVFGLTIGTNYTFSVESRSNQPNVPSEVFILNEDITTEVGLDDPANDSRVIESMEITNDYNIEAPSEGNNTFVTNSLSFTATAEFVVLYIRALNAYGTYFDGTEDKDIDVYFDNFSLVESATASSEDVFAAEFSAYPNPASTQLNIVAKNGISKVRMINAIGRPVFEGGAVKSIDVSNFTGGMYFLEVESEKGDKGTKKILLK